jgi:hypothetical protein
MRTRKLYIPIAEAHVGMVLGEDVQDNYRRPYQPAGLTLSDENLHQLAANHAEFICILAPDERSDDAIADDAAAATQRIQTIFQGADLTQPATAALLQQVLLYRSA